MAFDRTKMNKHADFAHRTDYQYVTPDAHTTVFASGYFNDAVEHCGLQDGDVITATCSVTGTKTLRMYVVTVNADTKVVTTAQLTAGS
jgi:hypothetical protein